MGDIRPEAHHRKYGKQTKKEKTMKNPSAEFRALRELFGLTQNNIGDALGRTRMTVKYWENPDCGTNPPDIAWKYMEERKALQIERIGKILEKAEENATVGEDGKKTARLLIYRDQAHYDVNNEKDPEIFGAANAAACTAAVMLVMKGYDIEWDYLPTPKALAAAEKTCKAETVESNEADAEN